MTCSPDRSWVVLVVMAPAGCPLSPAESVSAQTALPGDEMGEISNYISNHISNFS